MHALKWLKITLISSLSLNYGSQNLAFQFLQLQQHFFPISLLAHNIIGQMTILPYHFHECSESFSLLCPCRIFFTSSSSTWAYVLHRISSDCFAITKLYQASLLSSNSESSFLEIFWSSGFSQPCFQQTHTNLPFHTTIPALTEKQCEIFWFCNLSLKVKNPVHLSNKNPLN